MSATDFFASMVSGFSDVIHPVEEALESPQAFEAFIAQFGWSFENDQKSVDALQASFQHITAAFADMDAAVAKLSKPDADTLALLPQVLHDIDIIYNGVKTIKANVTAGSFTLYPFNQPSFWETFSEEVMEYLLSVYLQQKLPILAAFLYFFGVLADELIIPTAPANRTPYFSKTIQWDRIPKLFTQPGKLFDEVYQWGTASFNYQLFVLNLYRVFSVLYLPVTIAKPAKEELDAYFDPASTARQFVYKLDLPVYSGIKKDGIDFVAVDLNLVLMPIPPANNKSANPVGFVIYPFVYGKIGETVKISDAIAVTLSEGFSSALVRSEITPGNTNLTASASDTDLNATITGTIQPATPWILLGAAGSTRLEVSKAQMILEAKGHLLSPESMEYSVAIGAQKLSLVVDFSEGDGFLSKIFGSGPRSMDLSFSLGWSSKTGFFFGTSANLEFCIPVHESLLGVIDIDSICIGLKPIQQQGKSGASLEAFLNGSIKLGPLTLVIEGVGLNAAITPVDNNNTAANGIKLGELNLDFSFRPPDGVGISVDAGGITGGGFLRFDDVHKEYTGALELSFKDLFSLKAFGIITTQMPDGSSGFSMLIVITAEFTPVQLGFGFTLNGVGGLLGLHRTTKADVLRQGIKTNAIESILFPQNVVANINRIISDIKQVFPPQQGHFLLCPMGKIGWGTPTLVTLELGLLIEIPVAGFKILGVLKALLPDEDEPLLRLQVNFLGEVDFDNKSISFIASLYDSKLLTFTLSGDMAFRILYGDQPLFLLSVGGFHPSFTQVPADLKDMKRLTISLYDGDSASITLQSYFAVTSNTVQFGAKAALFAGSRGGFNIYGFVNYDVLFQFDPFHFNADIGGSVSLRHGTSTVMGIHVSGELSGPGPWDAKGEASVSFFFFSVSVPFHVSWGSADNDTTKEKADLLSLLQAEIGKDSNWTAAIPANNKLHVTVKKITAAGETTIVHPFGVLSFSERLLPLGVKITKFGNELPANTDQFTIVPSGEELSYDVLQEEFAAANFFDMSDHDKLVRPSFERMTSGFKLKRSSALQVSQKIIIREVEYELSYPGKVQKNRFRYPPLLFKAHTKLGAASQSSISKLNNRVSVNAPAAVGIVKEEYVLANTSDMKQYAGATITGGSYTEVLQQYNQLVKINPQLKDQLQVLPTHELNLN